jgi:hypothetical protein
MGAGAASGAPNARSVFQAQVNFERFSAPEGAPHPVRAVPNRFGQSSGARECARGRLGRPRANENGAANGVSAASLAEAASGTVGIGGRLG